MDSIKKLMGGEVDRRGFVKGSGAAALGIAGTALLGGTASSLLGAVPSAAQTASPAALSATDIAVLNFALNLEYLEAEFYTKATTGKTISQLGIPVSGTGTEGPTLGGQEVNFGDDGGLRGLIEELFERLPKIANQIAEDERNHVLLLRSVLGSNAIAKPEINLDALGRVRNGMEFLQEARAFEDVGVSAYGGAAPLIQSTAVLATAARIALTEGLHTGNLRLLVAQNHVPTTALDSQDVLPPPSGTHYFGVNQQGLTIVRTTSEVLAIVYGNAKAGTNKGGFFPQGANGAITTV